MRRKHLRIKVEVECLLIGHDGANYEALLDDISLSGASVRVNADTHFRVGDMCYLMLSDESAKYPVKHSGKIVRIDSQIIGVTFLR